MKKVLLLVLAIILAALSTLLFAQSNIDTIVNKGDGKVIILDQRPRVIINRPIAPKPVDPVIIKEQPIVNNYYPIERVIEISQKDDKYSIGSWLAAILSVGLLAWFIIWLLQREDKCNCNRHSQCNHNHPVTPVVNHFHVAGGNAIIDTSKNFNKYQPDHHYHKHTYVPVFPFTDNPKKEQAATGAKESEVK